MTDMMKTRQQGLDERTEQVRDEKARVLTVDQEKAPKQEMIDKINANKIAFRAEQERSKAEQIVQQQVGLPQMPRKEALQEEIQANQHQNQIFAGVKTTERFRMGQEQERQGHAKQEHGFEMKEKDANNRVLEAGNNPTPEKKDELDLQLKRQEQKFKALMRDPNVPLAKKAKAFEAMAQGIKMKNGGKVKTDARKQIERQKALIRKVALEDRKRVKKGMQNVDKTGATTKAAALRKLERCA